MCTNKNRKGAASGTKQPRNSYPTMIVETKVVELDMISPKEQPITLHFEVLQEFRMSGTDYLG